MDSKQLIVQRAQDFFADRIDDVLHVVRQDRQELRGWEEPGHLRAVARRTIREAGGGESEEMTDLAVAVGESGRAAGEPDRGQQREALGQLLEAGAAALEKIIRKQPHDITPAEVFGLEVVLLFYARPAVLVSEGRLASVSPPLWNWLEDQREDIEVVQRGVGRIELFGHPDLDWAGTGFLVSDTALVTTRRAAELFIENRQGQWQFRPGITAWMNYRSQYQRVATAGYQVRSVLGVHDRYDLAVLEVEPPQPGEVMPTPLVLASQPPPRLEGRPIYLVGYPVRDARRNEPEAIARIFRDVYNVKRVLPGTLRTVLGFREIELLLHDSGQLGQLGGSPVVDLETHQVVGVQLAGRYMEPGTAIPVWVLRNDPLLHRAGVVFAESSTDQLRQLNRQLERLAHSRYWPELQSTITSYYRKAFGNPPTF
jgi:hypothetical protein